MADDRAKAVARMQPVVGTMQVSVAECMEMLKRDQWQAETIVMLFEGDAPPRVQIGSTMLVVNK